MAEPFTLDFPEPLPVARRGDHWRVEGDGVAVRLTNLDKVFWPKEGITKGDVLAYYHNVAPYILPHIRGRPLTLKRMPDGIEGGHFYQKDAPDGTPSWMPRCAIEPEDGKVDEMLMVENVAHLLHLVNLGCIEVHPLHGTCERYDYPDYLVFDLDPFAPAGFEETLAVARHVEVILDSLGLEGFPKTSGATGVQVYVPVASHHTYQETRELAERIGGLIVDADPATTMEWEVRRRSGKVFIDHNMNRRAASLAAAYSVRPRSGAPVSTPVTWDEILAGDVRPGDFGIENIFARLAERGDLFLPVAETAQDLGPALERLGVAPSRAADGEDRLRRRIEPEEGEVTEREPAYQRKRRFDATPEPPSEVVDSDVDPVTAPVGKSFVIQQHHATRLHHDLRLEMLNGDQPVLVSWAVPKGLPTKTGVRALAIHTEDHPMRYATFSGTIPEGNYGAGEVRIFDSGDYEMVDRDDDRITFRLHGRRLEGEYHLIRTGEEDGKEQWLAILREDHRPAADPPPTPEPMLANLTKDPFDDPAWGFEPKWDGIRAMAVCTAGETRLISRNLNDVTAAYPELEGLADRVVAIDAILDGEVVAMEEGVPSFQRLQSRMHVRGDREVERLARELPVTYIVFDLVYLDGSDLTRRSLSERRELLEEIVVPSEFVQISPLMPGEGEALYRAAAGQGLEGIVAKRLDSRYELGKRSRSWLKVKTTLDADVVIVGWKPGEGRRSGTIGSLVMAMYEEGSLRYVGSVGSGLDQQSLAALEELLTPRERQATPFSPEVVREYPELRKASWVEPDLVAKVEYRQLTEAGKLRAPVFQGLRDDKRAEECRFEDLG